MYKNTIAYIAGVITASLYNKYLGKRNDLPPITLCMRDYMHLRVVMGKYYNLLKNDRHINKNFIEYEKLISKLNLTKKEKGNYIYFMFGFTSKAKKEKYEIY